MFGQCCKIDPVSKNLIFLLKSFAKQMKLKDTQRAG